VANEIGDLRGAHHRLIDGGNALSRLDPRQRCRAAGIHRHHHQGRVGQQRVCNPET
jgi:hypothetical protein